MSAVIELAHFLICLDLSICTVILTLSSKGEKSMVPYNKSHHNTSSPDFVSVALPLPRRSLERKTFIRYASKELYWPHIYIHWRIYGRIALLIVCWTRHLAQSPKKLWFFLPCSQLEFVVMDILGHRDKTRSNNQYDLVFTDCFTKP